MDQDVINLAKAIRQKESKGNFNAVGDAGTSHGGYQWQDATWKANARDILGDENAQMTPDNQNAVAYGVILKDKQKGLNPAQIAAKWNSGKTEGWENMIGETTINGQKVKYNVPQYVKDVTDTYQTLKGESQIPESIQPLEPTKKPGVWFQANENDTPLQAGAKTLGNVIPSAFNFAKNVVKSLNPAEIVKNVQQIPEEFRGLQEDTAELGRINERGAQANQKVIDLYLQKKESGQDVSALENYFKSVGIDPNKGVNIAKTPSAFGLAASSVPKTAYETLVPEAARDVIKGDFASAAKKVTEDPFGQVAPFVLAGRGIAGKADAVASRRAMASYAKAPYTTKTIPKPVTKYGDTFDTSMTKITDTVTKPIKTIFGKTGEGISSATKFGIGQATGLAPDTISEVVKTPSAFTKTAMKSAGDRASLGQEIHSSLQKKAATLEETSKAYEPIRQSKTPVRVDKQFVQNVIRETTGVDIKNGKVTTTGKATIRDATEVRALQNIINLWDPVFRKGELTPTEFLNFRSDLAKLSKFERQIGKSQPLENVSKIMRGRLNQAYRPQLKGLDVLDESFSSQRTELNTLSKNLVDRNGNLTEAAVNRIANATGKGKDALLARLEEIVPGITQKIKILKAVEDIQNASGIKVGAYTRTALVGGGLVMGGPITAAINAILTSPQLAVPILRQYGLLKNSAAIKMVVNALKEGGNIINNPAKLSPYLNKERELSLGLSIEDVNKNPAKYADLIKKTESNKSVKSETFYRGQKEVGDNFTKNNNGSMLGNAPHFSSVKEVAQQYGKNIKEFSFKKEANIKKYEGTYDLMKEVNEWADTKGGTYRFNTESNQIVSDWAKANKIDGVIVGENGAVFNNSAVLNKPSAFSPKGKGVVAPKKPTTTIPKVQKNLEPFVQEIAKKGGFGQSLPKGIDISEIKKAEVFGSSVKGGKYNDVDVAVFLDENHPTLLKIGSEYNRKVGNIEYHVLPDNDYGHAIYEAMLDMKKETGKGFGVKVPKSVFGR